MKTLVIGGTGRIGTYLVRRLVDAGHEVVSMNRGSTSPYIAKKLWQGVKHIAFDRKQGEETGTFIPMVRDVKASVVIDLLCYNRVNAEVLLEAVAGRAKHILVCGTIAVYGISREIPTTEAMSRRPSSEYGRGKAEMAAYLLDQARIRGLPITILHPGHVVGSGYGAVNPQGNFNRTVFEKLAAGEEVSLPDNGMATLHHVHADDLAQAFVKAINRWSIAVGEEFNILSPAALTLQHYASSVARWFGKQAKLRLLPWKEWKETISTEDAKVTHDHISRSPCFSIDKARQLLGYDPHFSSLEGIRRALRWLIAHQMVKAPSLS